MQLGFYFNQSRCTGCYACVIACRDCHDDLHAETPNYVRIGIHEKGTYPLPALSYMFTTCYHCARPLCASACPVEAIVKRSEDGIVIVDKETCLGKENCEGFCLQACPYRIPQFGSEIDSKMQKCDLCLDRWPEQKKPVCVEACIMRALDAGPLEELKIKHGEIHVVEGFTFVRESMPSVIFYPKAKPCASG